MDNKKSENWLQLFSTVAVLAGIGLVVIELRQSTELVELQILKQDVESANEIGISVLPENIYEIRQKSIDAPESLTHMEFRALDGFFWYFALNRGRGLYDLTQRGLLDDGIWQRAVAEDVRAIMAYPFGRAYWGRLREAALSLPPEFIDVVDNTLADAPYDFSKDAFVEVGERLKEIQAERPRIEE